MGRWHSRITLFVLLITLGGAMSPAGAGLFTELFQTPVSGEAAFEAAYPPFNFTGNTGSTIDVNVSGVCVITGNPASGDQRALIPGLYQTRKVWALVGASNSGGSYNVGLALGPNLVVFHPGYGGAALRVEGPGGFGNTNVGFTPANNVLHLLQLRITPSTGLVQLRLTDGANPSNSFTTSFTSPGVVNGSAGLRREGGTTGTGLYDSFHVAYDTTMFSETFDLDVANAAQFANPYSDFALSLGSGAIDVTKGIVRMGGPSGGDMTALIPGLVPPGGNLLHIQADVGATLDNGAFNVGLQIGQNNLVFHPGFGGGAFRVEGPGGFWNTNMGFTPANGILHHLSVDVTATGLFTILFTDGLDPSKRFTASFMNSGSVGGAIGFRRSGPTSELGLYDNLEVDIVPEPATLSLLALGGLALLRRRRRTRGM